MKKPELNGMGGNLSVEMFCREGRYDREVFWAGFGFQVWLQFLTHILGAQESSIIIVDEPDIYLHPDLQRQLLSILQSSGKQVLLATHSVEIMSQAEFEDVLFIDKRRTSGRRINDVEGLQSSLEAIGSSYDVHLNRLAHGKRVLFFEAWTSKSFGGSRLKLD